MAAIPMVHQLQAPSDSSSFSHFFLPFIPTTKAYEKWGGGSRKSNCKNNFAVTLLYVKDAQRVGVGLNYLNLSDLPSCFSGTSISFLQSFSLFIFSHTHLNFSQFLFLFFLNPSSFSSLEFSSTPCRYVAFISRCKATASHQSIPPSLPQPLYSPPTECLIFDEEGFEVS